VTSKKGFRSLFVDAGAVTPDVVEPTLWNDAVSPAVYVGDNDKYQAAVMEQYKLYVEIADRVSARRSLANAFFLTLNTAVFTAIGVFWKDRIPASEWALSVPLVVLVGQCVAWFWIIRSYRQLNSGKWAVVGALERRLPASPYWRGEWKALGEGNDRAQYWPITHVEQLVPLFFALAYVGGFLVAVLA
jgi:hypothetical protein